MKKLTLTLLATVLLAGSGFALAQEKIAVFNLQAAILATDDAQKRIKDFQGRKAYTELRADFDQARADLTKLDEELKKNEATWSQERKAEQRRQMEFKQADLELVAKKLQSEDQEIMQQLLRANVERAQEVIQDLIESENISLLLNMEAVAYMSPNSSYNITSKITDRLNKAK